MFQKLKLVGQQVKREFVVYRGIANDPRTPKIAKILLGLALGYAVLPFDLIPDWIPVLGMLDDLIIVPVLVLIALKMIPEDVIVDHRQKTDAENSRDWR